MTQTLFNLTLYFVAMIDSVGGSTKVNNMLSTLNMKPISKKNLQSIERRAGTFVESVAKQSASNAAHDAFQKEMRYEFNKYKGVKYPFF